MLNVKQLKKYLKPSKPARKKVYLKEYKEDKESTTIKYQFKGQKDSSNLTVPINIWSGMKFEVIEDTVEIVELNGLEIITNENNWSRLALPTQEGEEEDE